MTSTKSPDVGEPRPLHELMPPEFRRNRAYVIARRNGFGRACLYYVRHDVWMSPTFTEYGAWLSHNEAQTFAGLIYSMNEKAADEAFAALDLASLQQPPAGGS